MTIQIGAVAPDFEADTTEGRIRFHDWIGNSWALLFSHPKDFTPVCTTELGTLARLKPEFDKRGVKLIGISVDPVDRHEKWSEDIKETQGYAPNYPMIGDTDLKVAKLYNMLPAETAGGADGRTAADWGLVWRCVDDEHLLATAHEMAQRLADGPPLAIAAIKQQLDRAWADDLAPALDAEAEAQSRAFVTQDLKEGAAAFVERRAPRFVGR